MMITSEGQVCPDLWLETSNPGTGIEDMIITI